MADDQQPQQAPPRETDQEIKDRQTAELNEEREEHNRRTGGGTDI
jgi:hypothetical protein